MSERHKQGIIKESKVFGMPEQASKNFFYKRYSTIRFVAGVKIQPVIPLLSMAFFRRSLI